MRDSFLACCPLQQTKENVSHVKITKETEKGRQEINSRQLQHRTSYLPLPQTEKEKLMGDEKNSEKDFEKEKKKKQKRNQKNRRKGCQTKKRKKKGKAGFLFILLILLAVICAGVYLLIPSKNRVSHNQYFGLEDDNQYGLIVNSEIVDITNGAPFEENGVWYLPFSTLYYEISDAFYY